MENEIKEISKKLKAVANVKHRHMIAQNLAERRIEQIEVVENLPNDLNWKDAEVICFYQDEKTAADVDRYGLEPADENIIKTEKGYFDFQFFENY